MNTAFTAGARVRLLASPDRVGTVDQPPRKFGGEWYVKIRFASGEVEQYPAEALEGVDVVYPPEERLRRGEYRSIQFLRGNLTREKLAHPRRDVLYSLRSAKTQFLPYQYKPVLKFLESPARGLLIADEVGLGKTIEAGYILRELQARERDGLTRVLVACPAVLRRKWQEELNRRFGERFEIADARGLREAAMRAERDGHGYQFRLIASFNTLRNAKTLGLLATLSPINLTIIDEAHHFRNAGTQTSLLGRTLRDVSDSLVLLSATPVHLGSDNLFQLLRMLDSELFRDRGTFNEQFEANRQMLKAARMATSGQPDALTAVAESLKQVLAEKPLGIPLSATKDLLERLPEFDLATPQGRTSLRSELRELSPLSTVISRTRKREVVVDGPKRDVKLVPVEFTREERLIYDFFSGRARKAYGSVPPNLSGNVSSVRFRATLIQQQLTSCLPAFLERHFVSDSALRMVHRDGDVEDPYTDPDAADQEASFEIDGFSDDLIDAIRVVRKRHVDSKFHALLEAVREQQRIHPTGKIVLFSFFKHTLGYLEERLRKAGVATALISGDVPSRPDNPQEDERGKRVRRFHDDPAIRILLSSEVGAEGLDFQEASNVVIHYDLPWNPMRVEQRIGRVDRFGQKQQKVYSVSFALQGTLDERIRGALYSRIDVFRNSIGDLEEIIGTDFEEIDNLMMSPDLTDDERASRVIQIAEAIAHREEELRKLERQGDALLGHDDVFDRELQGLDSTGRSISAAELADFVESALVVAGVRFTAVHAPQRRTIVSDVGRLKDFLRNALPTSAQGRSHLLSERPGTSIELAYQDPDAVHNITVVDPLVSAAINAQTWKGALPERPVVRVRLKDSTVAPGPYLFAFAKLSDKAPVRPTHSIQSVCCDINGILLPTKIGDPLVQRAMVEGVDEPGPPPERLPLMLQSIEEGLVIMQQDRQRALTARHARAHLMRMDSLIGQKDREYRRLDSRIAQPDFHTTDFRIQRMIRSRHATLASELAELRKQRDDLSPPTLGLAEVAMGLIEVH